MNDVIGNLAQRWPCGAELVAFKLAVSARVGENVFGCLVFATSVRKTVDAYLSRLRCQSRLGLLVE